MYRCIVSLMGITKINWLFITIDYKEFANRELFKIGEEKGNAPISITFVSY